MFSIYSITLLFLVYMGLLFVIAYAVENKYKKSKLISSPYIYALSFAIYCTAWTYYGSVGSASKGGFLFLAVYLGPTFIILLWPIILKKMIRIKNLYKVTSIADLIASRYDKSRLIGAIVGLGCLIGTVPYISIQLKSLIESIGILTIKNATRENILNDQSGIGLLIVALMIFFTIIFGLRKMDSTERHEGMIVIVAIESIFKLVAIVIIGTFICFFVFDGVDDILNNIKTQEYFQYMSSEKGGSGYATWASVLILSMFAVMFLPRQFHMSVVENSNENHIKTVMWVFPVYLLIITFFTVPIAMAGNILNASKEFVDFHVLTIPIQTGNEFLSLLAFLGGFSAATSMIMVTAMTMAIMISNYLLLPLIERFEALHFLKRRIKHLRWAIVVVFIYSSYLFYTYIVKDSLIVGIGLISFTAILQLVPSILGGLFWKKASKRGAFHALMGGFTIWFYTLIIPQFAKGGLLDSSILTDGLFGMSFLKPTELFGFAGYASIPHAVFWTMVFNISLFVYFSINSKRSKEEIDNANTYVDIMSHQEQIEFSGNIEENILFKNKLQLHEQLLNNYFDEYKTQVVLKNILTTLGYENKEKINILEYSKFNANIEQYLSGNIGSAGAHNAVKSFELYTEDETAQLSNVYAQMLAKMNITPEDLNKKINFYEEKEETQKEHALQLQKRIDERDEEIQAKEKAEEEIIELNNNLEIKVEQRTRLVALKTKKIEDLLDNAGEGFLSFGLNFYIDNEYSKECEIIFGKKLDGENILNLLWDDNTHKIDFFASTLTQAASSEDSVLTKSFLSLLDKEFTINGKVISIEYKLLENEYKLLEDKRFMLILTDISKQKKLEKRIKTEQEILKMVVSIVSDTAQFYDIKSDYDIFDDKKLSLVHAKNTSLNNLNVIYRQIHTFKGLFSQLFMTNIVEKLHSFETKLSNYIKNQSINNSDIIQLLQENDFNSWLEEDIDILIKILGRKFLEEKSIIKIDKKSMKKLENKISKYCHLDREHANNYEDILNEIEKLKSVSLKDSLLSYPKLCSQLALQFEKEIYKFEIIGDDDVITPNNFKPFLKSLVHVFRNCIDHGIELPEEREMLEKDIIGTISCSFKKDNNKIVLLISDDGKGINPDNIKNSFVKKGLDTKENLEKLNEKEILNLIFADEFSSKEEVTDISGRGIGMSAVKDEVQKIAGSVEVFSEINKGTTFVFTLPFKREEVRI